MKKELEYNGFLRQKRNTQLSTTKIIITHSIKVGCGHKQYNTHIEVENLKKIVLGIKDNISVNIENLNSHEHTQ